MRHIHHSILFLVCLTGLFASFVMAQENNELAEIKYDKQNKIAGIYWSEAKPDFSCIKTYEKLRLVKILYEDDADAYQIGNLIFSNSKGIREEFIFSINPTRDYSTLDASNIRVFIGEENWYRVGAFRCGAGGNSDPQIFSLEKPVEQRIIKKSKKN